MTDWDGDGDLDLLVGDQDGTVMYWERSADGSLQELAGSSSPFHGIDVGDFAAPTAVDWDGDGDLDFLVGEFYGTVMYWSGNGCVGTCSGSGICKILFGVGQCRCLEGHGLADCSGCVANWFGVPLAPGGVADCRRCPGPLRGALPCALRGVYMDNARAQERALLADPSLLNYTVSRIKGTGTCTCNPHFSGIDCTSGLCPKGLGLSVLVGGEQACEMCTGGTFKDKEGDQACTLCPSGAESAEDGTACACPQGKYFTLGPPASCEVCPPGRSTKGELPATSKAACFEPMRNVHGLSHVSGRSLLVELTGAGLLTGHQLSVMAECAAKPEGPIATTPDGSTYEFELSMLRGGDYRLCWCADILLAL